MTDTDPSLRSPEQREPTHEASMRQLVGSSALELAQTATPLVAEIEPLDSETIDHMKRVGALLPDQIKNAPLRDWPEGAELTHDLLLYFNDVFTQDELRELCDAARTSPRQLLYFLDYLYETFLGGDASEMLRDAARTRTRRSHAAFYGIEPEAIAQMEGVKSVSAIRSAYRDIIKNLTRSKTLPGIRLAYENMRALIEDPSFDPNDLPELPLPVQSARKSGFNDFGITPSIKAMDHNDASKRGLGGALWAEQNKTNDQIELNDILAKIAPDDERISDIADHFRQQPTSPDSVPPEVLKEFLSATKPDAEAFMNNTEFKLEMMQKVMVKLLFGLPIRDKETEPLSVQALVERYKAHGGEAKLRDLADKWRQFLVQLYDRGM